MCAEYMIKLEHLWGQVGYIVNLSQMIEYTLANILAFNELFQAFDKADSISTIEYNEFAVNANKWYSKLERKPFGFGIKRANDVGIFTSEVQNLLKNICKERNFVVHRLFKEDLFSKNLDSNPSFYNDRLETIINDMYTLNEYLNEIFRKQKEVYKLIW